MIGHEHVGVQFASCLGERFLQPMQIALVIRLAKEARLAIVAALHDMQGQAIKVNSRAAGHGWQGVMTLPDQHAMGVGGLQGVQGV